MQIRYSIFRAHIVQSAELHKVEPSTFLWFTRATKWLQWGCALGRMSQRPQHWVVDSWSPQRKGEKVNAASCLTWYQTTTQVKRAWQSSHRWCSVVSCCKQSAILWSCYSQSSTVVLTYGKVKEKAGHHPFTVLNSCFNWLCKLGYIVQLLYVLLEIG